MSSILQRSVLVLNRFWQPIHACSARRAMQLLALGNASVVQVDGEDLFATHDFRSWIRYSQHGSPQEMIRSVRLHVRVPDIIVLSHYGKLPRKDITFSRRNVFLRDDFTCQYCRKRFSESELNLDHVIPRQKGGTTSWENIVTSCIKCNTRKANKMPSEANMLPLQRPIAPRWRPNYGWNQSQQRSSWSHFLNLSRDRVVLATD